jgi:hypothetical protein
MVDSLTRGMKTTGRLGLAVAGAAMLLAVGPLSSASALPSLSITSPQSSVSSTATVMVSGTTSDTIDPISLTIAGAHGELVTGEITLPANSWSDELQVPADDAYTVVARQSETTESGLETATQEVAFGVKTHAPSVSLARSVSNETVGFSGHAGDGPGDEAKVLVLVFAEGASEPLQTIEATREGQSWSSQGLELPPGKYSAYATQSDTAVPEHHTGVSAPRSFTIEAEDHIPLVSLNTSEFADQNGTLVTASATPRFVTEPVSDAASVTLSVYAGTSAGLEVKPAEQLAMAPSGATWTATSQPLANGIYTAQAQIEDAHGAKGVSAPVIFSVQVPVVTTPPATPAPTAPSASFTWVPASPAAGQSVSLVSNSLSGSSPIDAFAWDVAGNGSFAPAGPVMTTSFATAGAHVVHLRVADANGLSGVAARTIQVGPAALRLLQPFPIVRIAGAETAAGVRIRLLTVQAPLSATVAVTCKGTGCKTKSESRLAVASAKNKSKGGVVMLTFQRFERALRAGVVLQIRVTKAGQIGKYTSFKIRRHKLPLRSDACLSPTSATPVACPTS